MNNTSKYFDLMGDTSQKVDDVIGKILNQKQFNNNEKIKELFIKRYHQPKMRPFLTQLTYWLLGGQGEIAIANAVSEINNIQVYLDNWILDDKNNAWRNNARPEISAITINSQIYRELTDKLISELRLSPLDELKIRKELNQTILDCYLGQTQDLAMTIDSIDSYKNDDHYIKNYIEKNKLASGSLYRFSAFVGGIMAKANKKQLEIVFQLGETLGTGLHLSNDLGDFAIFKTNANLKSYQDQMADLMSRRLTLPIYYILKYGKSPEKEKVFIVANKGSACSYDEKLAVSKLIVESGAYDFSFKIIKSFFREAKKILHQNFEKSDIRDLFSRAISSIKTNKYLYHLKNTKCPWPKN